MMKHFIRFNPETGTIISQGSMQEKHIQSLIESGESMIIIDSPLDNLSSYRINLQTGKIESIPFDFENDIQSKINEIRYMINTTMVDELSRTDYTQGNDAIDHMTQEEIDAYKIYRARLRDVIGASTLLEAIELLPETDPRGNIAFSSLKNYLNDLKNT